MEAHVATTEGAIEHPICVHSIRETARNARRQCVPRCNGRPENGAWSDLPRIVARSKLLSPGTATSLGQTTVLQLVGARLRASLCRCSTRNCRTGSAIPSRSEAWHTEGPLKKITCRAGTPRRGAVRRIDRLCPGTLRFPSEHGVFDGRISTMSGRGRIRDQPSQESQVRSCLRIGEYTLLSG